LAARKPSENDGGEDAALWEEIEEARRNMGTFIRKTDENGRLTSTT